MKVKELRKLLVDAAQKHVSPTEAQYFADEVIETDIRKQSRDAKYNKGIVNDIRSWEGKVAPVKKTIDLPGYTQYDLEGRGPSLMLKEIHDDLEKKAKTNGISMVSIVNSGGMHVMHLWTQGLAKRGLFAMGAWNGGPEAVVPINGTKGILGTNPFTYAFPSDKGEVVIDMATSEIPFFKILNASKDNTSLPPNTAVDNEGELTTDPNKAIDAEEVANLLPMGGNYKGYNINYLMEIMTSALVGALASSQMANGYVETEHGGFIIAIAIDKVTSRDSYDAAIQSMNEKIRAQKPRQGVERVIVPGDSNLERKAGMTEDSEFEISDEYKEALAYLGV